MLLAGWLVPRADCRATCQTSRARARAAIRIFWVCGVRIFNESLATRRRRRRRRHVARPITTPIRCCCLLLEWSRRCVVRLLSFTFWGGRRTVGHGERARAHAARRVHETLRLAAHRFNALCSTIAITFRHRCASRSVGRQPESRVCFVLSRARAQSRKNRFGYYNNYIHLYVWCLCRISSRSHLAVCYIHSLFFCLSVVRLAC